MLSCGLMLHASITAKLHDANESVNKEVEADMNTDDRCARCGEGRLRSWSELGDDEREVVRRLPASAEYSQEVREQSHRWCTRCWYEATDDMSRTA